MTWIILAVNIATLAVALRKRMLPYFILTIYFVLLVVAQAFQIDSDLTGRAGVSYLYSFMTQEGFHQALWFLLGASALSLILVCLGQGYKPGTLAPVSYEFKPPRFFYPFLFLTLCGLAASLIFVVVGLANFLSASRPGMEPGSTIFLTLLGFGIYPLLLKIICRTPIISWDLACAFVPLFVSMGFSRMHVILYVTTLISARYYSRGWADRPLRAFPVIASGLGAILFGFAFLFLGAIRDAQNSTAGASVFQLIEYNFEHPETNMLSVSVTYQRSVEAMSGLAGAFTAAESDPGHVIHDFGVGWVLEGVLLALPSNFKAHLSFIREAVVHYRWYTESIISSGLESSYTSFGWYGMVFYPFAFFLFAWVFCLLLVRQPLSAPLKLSGWMLLGCGTFFVRGSYPGWIGYSIAYCATILASSPLWSLWVVPAAVSIKAEHASDVEGVPRADAEPSSDMRPRS